MLMDSQKFKVFLTDRDKCPFVSGDTVEHLSVPRVLQKVSSPCLLSDNDPPNLRLVLTIL